MQCRKCNQFFDDQFQVCPYCGEIMLDSTKPPEPTIQRKQKNKILPIILSMLIVAVPIGVRNGIREYRKEQYEQKNDIRNWDMDSLKKTIDTVLEDTNISDVSGVQTGDTYENAFFGIGCKLPDWTFLSTEELSEIDKQKQSNAQDSEVGVLAFNAKRADGLADVNMIIAENPFYGNPDEKSGLEEIANQVKEYTGVISCECIEGNIAGEKKYVLKTIVEQEGIHISLYQFLYFQKDKYAMVTVTALAEDEAESICGQFYKVDTE